MNTILVCNTADDSISKINIEDLSVEDISLGEKTASRGVFSIYETYNNIIAIDSYDDSIKILTKEHLEVIGKAYIGKGPKFLLEIENKIYVTCSDSNSLNLFNLLTKEIEVIKLGFNYPYKIEYIEEKGYLLVVNLFGDNVSVIEKDTLENISNIKMIGRPTDVKISEDNKYILIAEDSLDDGELGYLNIYDINTLQRIKKIRVGIIPSVIESKNGAIYVGNFGDGTINIIDLETLEKRCVVDVGGMPIDIVNVEEYLFVCDYDGNKIIVLDENYKKKKIIAVGAEPNAMIFINPYH